MSNPVKDRSGLGLPPKAERRAAGKAAQAARLRAKRRKRLLRQVGTGAGAIVLVAGLAVACTHLNPNPTAPAAAATPSAAAPVTTIDPSFDPALRTRPVVTKGDGPLAKLTATPIVTGKGAVVQKGQSITVNYVGAYYATGEAFDASWDRGQFATFPIGVGQVIPGWDTSLVGVTVGSRIQLDIPSDLAYGPTAAADGKPAGDLRFVVDILGVS